MSMKDDALYVAYGALIGASFAASVNDYDAVHLILDKAIGKLNREHTKEVQRILQIENNNLYGAEEL
jgi:hypothetical protein